MNENRFPFNSNLIREHEFGYLSWWKSKGFYIGNQKYAIKYFECESKKNLSTETFFLVLHTFRHILNNISNLVFCDTSKNFKYLIVNDNEKNIKCMRTGQSE